MKTIEIPGGSAELREKFDIKQRHKRTIESAAVAATPALTKLPTSREELENLDIRQIKTLTRQEADALFDLQDATIVAVLASWTRPEPPPTMDTIGDLDPDVYDALAEATRALGAEVATGVDFDPPNPHSEGFSESPTPPSDGSEAGSRADTESESTDTQPSSTPSTPIAESSPA